jgi:hypothetical protein
LAVIFRPEEGRGATPTGERGTLRRARRYPRRERGMPGARCTRRWGNGHPGAFQSSRASYGAVCSARRAAWLEGRRSSLTLMV